MASSKQGAFPLSLRDIMHSFQPQTFVKGEAYFKEGRVGPIHQVDEWTWIAEIKGNHGWYEVYIKWESPETLIAKCTCPAFDTWGECKHEVAILLALAEQRDRPRRHWSTVPNTSEEALLHQLLDTFTQLREENHQPAKSNGRQILQIQYLLEAQPYYGGYGRFSGQMGWLKLELKAGVNRLYVVKDLAQFVDSLGRQSYIFTPRFTYTPIDHALADEDIQITEMLRQYIEEYRFVQGDRLISEDKRRLLLTPQTAKQLLPLIAGRDNLLTITQGHQLSVENYRPIRYTAPEQLPITLRVETTRHGRYVLNMDAFKTCYFFPQYGFLFKEGIFYSIPPRHEQKIRYLFAWGHDQPQRRGSSEPLKLQMDRHLLAPFITEVVDQVQDVLTIQLDETIQERLIQHPLKAKIYVQEEEGQTAVYVHYHYGEYIFDLFSTIPFKEEKGEWVEANDVIIIRDKKQEQKIMGILEEAPLKVNQGKLLVAEGEKHLYTFLFETLPQLAEWANIYFDDKMNDYLDDEMLKAVLNVNLSQKMDWLEINFNIDDLDAASMKTILQGMKEKKRFVRLHNGRFIPLDRGELKQVALLAEQLELDLYQLARGKAYLPLYRAWQVDQLLGDERVKADYSQAFRRLLDHLRYPERETVDLPQSLQASLRSYQKAGFAWFKALSRYGLGGILADEMGLGKTVQTIAYLLSEWEAGTLTEPVLIVTPTSLMYNWLYELERFAPELTVHVVDGTKEERARLLHDQFEATVWITSYPLLRQDQHHYTKHSFSVLILDEAQHIKNHQSKVFNAVLNLKASRRFALTGTPIENRLEELWAILQAVLPGFFPKRQRFVQLSTEKVRQIIQPFILRRLKKEVLRELPDKIETVQLSELTREQKALYLHYLEQTKETARQALVSEGLNKGRIKILAALTRLRQICCHPALFLDNYRGTSGKLEQLVALTKEAVDVGRRLLIFSQFTSMLQMIKEALEQEGLNSYYLDGQTKAQTRLKMVEAFNQGEGELFLISLKAGGTGLNLTGADTVILYDLWWNPAVDDQAIGRAHRLGQKKVVQVIRLIARGTIEEKIYALQQKKKNLIEDVLTHDDQLLSTLTEEDLKAILDLV